MSHEILLFFSIFMNFPLESNYNMFIDFSDFKFEEALDFNAHRIFRWLPSAVTEFIFIKPNLPAATRITCYTYEDR